MNHIAEALILLGLLFVGVITLGEPDILDGWIKQANTTACTPSD